MVNQFAMLVWYWRPFLGAPLLIWRSKIAFDQAQTAQERMITDRFSKAVDQLGTVRRVPHNQSASETGVKSSWEEERPNIEVRLGGLYTLQRISEDSLPDHIRVIETICSYVRLNSLRQAITDEDAKPPRLDIDIEVALNILGKRSYERCVFEMNNLLPLYLMRATLPNSNLNSLKFPFADFQSCDLRYTTLRYTDLRQAWLEWTNFQFADFHKCRLHRASLRGADLRNTNVTMEALKLAHGVKSGFGETKLPGGIEPPDHWFEAPTAEKDSEASIAAYMTHYRKFLEFDKSAWRPELGKKIKIDEVRLDENP
ncbi:pentapeptide repeat-containing protein [Candidatus Competibacter phosphatis]|uniref:Pentapeptide repeat-containing protein n=2 Tax=Candidatus Competibacter phosphatis TaxID=221280 RepID=A0ABX1TJQ1_9GAMM|nr:pentapeptide repeat-containing protein [Candidatus Competibacter phosphatis]